jgi:3-deoxy-D-manno-octulosonate 8-phosphate phosphatase (KDO 8-P phosphatase)
MKIKLAILDIDGVLTDGKKYYGVDGIPFAKTYCDKDFTAIKRLRGSGVKVCFLSGDERVNKAMAHNRKIDFYSARGKDKADFVSQFENHYNVSRQDMLYIGDDLFDKSIMKIVGHAYCPNDACFDIKQVCGLKNILNSPGGNNAIAEMVETLLDRNLINDCSMQDIEDLDKQESF